MGTVIARREGASLFTGIVESLGTIIRSDAVAGGRRLRIDVGPIARECALGASVCVSGVCLTVAAVDGTTLDFDVVTETLDRTTLGKKSMGDLVNLERSLRVGDRLDGHFVQGHVDGTAVVDRVVASTAEHVIRFRPDECVTPYIVPKGSVAIDGVSLTIANTSGGWFSVALIPTTLEHTTLSRLKVGDQVNIESDIITRTVVHRLSAFGKPEGLNIESLTRAGFA